MLQAPNRALKDHLMTGNTQCLRREAGNHTMAIASLKEQQCIVAVDERVVLDTKRLGHSGDNS